MTGAARRLEQGVECLGEADRRVRALTFQVEAVRAGPLLAAWPGFVAASARLLDQLGPAGTPGATILGRQVSRCAWALSALVEPEPDLVAAAALLERAGQLLHHCHQQTASDPSRGALAARVWGTVWVGAHVVAGSARDQLETYAALITQVAQVEDDALTALQHADRYGRPANRPTPPDPACPVSAR